MNQDLKEKILSLISEVKPYDEVTAETRLLDEGILDSMSILALITLLEDELDIEIPDDAVTRENFTTIKEITGLAERLIG